MKYQSIINMNILTQSNFQMFDIFKQYILFQTQNIVIIPFTLMASKEQGIISETHLMDLVKNGRFKEYPTYIKQVEKLNDKAEQSVRLVLENILVKKLGKNPATMFNALMLYKQLIVGAAVDFFMNDQLFPRTIHEEVAKICTYKPNIQYFSNQGSDYFVDLFKISKTQSNKEEIEKLGNNYVLLALQLVQVMAKWYPNEHDNRLQKSFFKQKYEQLISRKITFPKEENSLIVQPADSVKFKANYLHFLGGLKKNDDLSERAYKKQKKEQDQKNSQRSFTSVKINYVFLQSAKPFKKKDQEQQQIIKKQYAQSLKVAYLRNGQSQKINPQKKKQLKKPFKQDLMFSFNPKISQSQQISMGSDSQAVLHKKNERALLIDRKKQNLQSLGSLRSNSQSKCSSGVARRGKQVQFANKKKVQKLISQQKQQQIIIEATKKKVKKDKNQNKSIIFHQQPQLPVDSLKSKKSERMQQQIGLIKFEGLRHFFYCGRQEQTSKIAQQAKTKLNPPKKIRKMEKPEGFSILQHFTKNGNFGRPYQSQQFSKRCTNRSSTPKIQKKHLLGKSMYLKFNQHNLLQNLAFCEEQTFSKNNANFNHSLQNKKSDPMNTLLNQMRLSRKVLRFISDYVEPLTSFTHSLRQQSLNLYGQSNSQFFCSKTIQCRLLKQKNHMFTLIIQNLCSKSLLVEYYDMRNIKYSSHIKIMSWGNRTGISPYELSKNGYMDIKFKFHTSALKFKFLTFYLLINNKLESLVLPITLLDFCQINKINHNQLNKYAIRYAISSLICSQPFCLKQKCMPTFLGGLHFVSIKQQSQSQNIIGECSLKLNQEHQQCFNNRVEIVVKMLDWGKQIVQINMIYTAKNQNQKLAKNMLFLLLFLLKSE